MRNRYEGLIDRFFTPKKRGRDKMIAILLIPEVIWLLYYIGNKAINGDLYLKDNFEIFSALTGFLVGFIALFSWMYQIVGLFFLTFFLEFYDDYFLALNAYEKVLKKIRYEDVVRIRKSRTPFLDIVIETKSGNIEIWEGINRYGKCVEMIRARATNLQSVDYGGLDKRKEWTRNSDGFL